MVILALGMLVALAVLEVFVFIQVAHAIGLLVAVILLFAVSFLGARQVKRQGLTTVRRIQMQWANAEVPGVAVLDGVLLLAAGVLLLVPGFITSALGLLLLLAPVRAAVRGVSGLIVIRRLDARMLRRW